MENISSILRRWRKQLILLLLLFVILIAGLFAKSLGFHAVNTSPNLDTVSYLAPYIKVNFNKNLVTKDVSYSSQDDIVTNFELEGKTLTLYIDKTMKVDKSYTITINNIQDTKGHVIKNKVLKFTTSDIAFSNLPQDQQDYIVDRPAAKPPYSVDSIGFVNFDSLTDSGGVPADQLDLLKDMFYGYSSQILKKEFSQITLNQASLVVSLHDPNSDDDTDKATFTVDIDGTTYRAEVSYSLLSSIFLRLYDSNGTQVFQSSDIS